MPRTFVKPEGDVTTAKFIIIGEQPGQKEIRYNRPFIGPAGRELTDDLQAAGINRSLDCYLTNVIKDLDHHLGYYVKMGRGEPQLSKEGLAYFRMLEDELAQSREDAILIPTGNVALYATCSRFGITKWRGSVLKSTFGTKRMVIPTFHPATVIPPKNQYLNKILIQHDFNKARELFNGGFKPPNLNLIIRPSYYEVVNYLQACYDKGLLGTRISFDIEIYNEQLSCISFSHDTPTEAFCIPFIDAKGDYFSIGEELEIMRMIATVLENSRIKKLGQNLVFDSHFLLRRYGIKTQNCDDTMVAQQTLMPEFPKGLDFITSIWTPLEYYKAEGKKFMRSGGVFETLWEYNDKDSIACAIAFPAQYESLKKRDNHLTYHRQVRLLEPLTYMMEKGIKIDVKGMTKRYDEMLIEIEAERENLCQLSGRELNANSPKQLMNYFYVEKGHKPYKSKGKDTTNELAMKRLARKGVKEAESVLKIRRAVKERSTYLNPEKIDKDGRIRCSYNPVGTRFSRLSSSESIFGTGNNLQNQPHHVLKYFISDEGYIFYSIDLAQAENRIVAYVGRVDSMIQAFENRMDVHSLTGSLISNLPYDTVREQDHNNICCHLGGGDKTWRFWGKKANHGLNYDLSFITFALTYEIPQNDGKYIVDKYHHVYPGVRQGYHSLVRRQLSENNRTITNLMGRKTVFLNEWGDALFKDAYSCIPQGTVGDVINERGIHNIYYNNDLHKPTELQMQVHDSIVFQLPLSLGWMEHAKIVMDIKNKLEIPLKVHGREFVIPADIAMGYNLYKLNMKEIKGQDCPTNINDLALELERNNYEITKESCVDAGDYS